MPISQPAGLPTAAQINQFIDQDFPNVHEGTGRLVVEQVGQRAATVRMQQDARMTRPGGTVSGPSMFKLADFAVYVAILGEVGFSAKEAVTTSMTMNFLTRPVPGDMLARVRLIKVGRRLAVAEVGIFSDGHDEMVAHATGTYAMASAAR
jgi:uncharacterized protein (TIGR00369 family)